MEFQSAELWNERLFVVFLNTINIPCTRLYIVATTTETAGNFAAVVVVQVSFQKKTQPEIQDVQEEVLSTFFSENAPVCDRLGLFISYLNMSDLNSWIYTWQQLHSQVIVKEYT